MKSNRDTPIYVVGNARHGKTTVARLLAAALDCSFADSSLFLADRVVMPYLKEHFGLEYPDAVAAHADRGPHRQKWRDAITEFNADDPSKLSGMIFETNRIYCGCRSEVEYLAGKEKYNAICIYVDAFERLQTKEETFDIPYGICDVKLDNNGEWIDTVNRLLTISKNFNLDGSKETLGRRGIGYAPYTIGEGYSE